MPGFACDWYPKPSARLRLTAEKNQKVTIERQEEIQYFFQQGRCLQFQVKPTLVFQLSYSVGSKTSPALPSQVLLPRSLQPVACGGGEKIRFPHPQGSQLGTNTRSKDFSGPFEHHRLLQNNSSISLR